MSVFTRYVLFVIFIYASLETVDGTIQPYLSNDEIYDKLDEHSRNYPALTKLHSVGESTSGRKLWVLSIGNNVKTHVPLRPHVRLVGNMHGNEVLGRELLMKLANYLLSNYEKDNIITDLLNTTVIHIMPTMNPDGFNNSNVGECHGLTGRNNANDLDLNRNFPNSTKALQKETAALINWMKKETHVLVANLHGGALLANYPFDSLITPNGVAPDDDVFKFLALNYSQSHPNMSEGYYTCARKPSKYFKNGITRGVDWYAVIGGMQDYTYLEGSGYELTLEVSCCKYPNEDQIEKEWDKHRQSLLSFISNVHMGVKGLVLYSDSSPVANANVVIVGREFVVFQTTSNGEYWKLLLPGTYTLKVWLPEHKTPLPLVNFTVSRDKVSRVDLTLDGKSDPNFAEKRRVSMLMLFLIIFCQTLLQ